MKARDLCTLVLVEIGAVSPIDTPDNPTLQHVLTVTNRLLDSWNADRRAVYTDTFTSYTLTPNHQPHLIGPGLVVPDFAATQRPVSIKTANIILTNVNPVIRQPLHVRDDVWWAQNPLHGITTSFPTDLYYEPDWPNGSLFLWPVPTTAWQLELETRVLLTQIATLDTVINLPPGYQEAIAKTVEEALLPTFGRLALLDAIAAAGRAARARIFGTNDQAVRIATRDSGMPTSGGPRSTFNFYTGLTR